MRIVVLGYIVRGPIGGMAWHHLQYLLGLRQLGHEVLLVEDSDDYASCYDPNLHQMSIDARYGLDFTHRAMTRLGMGDDWAYFDAHTSQWMGPAASRAVAYCLSADVVLNVSGVNPLRTWTESIPARVLVDTDPVFTQIKHMTRVDAAEAARRHTDFFTFGELIGSAESTVPDDGFDWKPTRQPVALDQWPVLPAPADGNYTTVMQWESYDAGVHDGKRYGLKSDSFAAVWDLPSRVGVRLELALGGESAPRRRLAEAGWTLVDPLAVTRNPWTYRDYLQNSRGEFSVAKEAYVSTSSGWFSERTACYLASGRPAVVADTGFSRYLPTGDGLHAFVDENSAAAALEQVERNVRAESQRAREIAEQFFDAPRVLASLLDRIQ